MSVCLDDSLKNALDAEGICDSKSITQRHVTKYFFVFDDYTSQHRDLRIWETLIDIGSKTSKPSRS